MRALTWQGKRHVEVQEAPHPVLQEPTDAVERVTSTAICGSDLHLYEVLGPFPRLGDVLGHEAMGVVEQVGSGVPHLAPGGGRRVHASRRAGRAEDLGLLAEEVRHRHR